MKTYLKGLIVALVVAVSACASVPAKQRVVATHQTVHAALVTLDETERSLCQPKPAPQSNQCANPDAVAIGLTDARHQELSRILATAFTLDAAAGKAVIVWRAGDPTPPDLEALLTYAQTALDVASSITNTPLLTQARALVTQVQSLLTLLGR